MAFDIFQLETRYLHSCKQHEVLPNCSILSSFSRVKHQKFWQEHRVLKIFIDQLVDSDFPPLIDALSSTSLSGIDAVDVCQRSSHVPLRGDYVLSLLHVVNQKLRIVDLIDWSFWKNILRDICHRGLACRILNLQRSPIRKLDMTGKFMQLHRLNLDFSVHLTSFQINCFNCMPRLVHLSMCATRVSNLWTTTAALSRLPSLTELRFQNCFCCYGTGPCSKSGDGAIISKYDKVHSGQQNRHIYIRSPPLVSDIFFQRNLQHSSRDESLNDLYSGADSFANKMLLQNTADDSSDEGDSDFLSNRQAMDDLEGILHDNVLGLDGHTGILESPPEHNILIAGSSPRPMSNQLIDEIYSTRGIKNGISTVDRLEDLNNINVNERVSLDEFNCQFDFESYNAVSKVNALNSDSATGTSELGKEKPISHHPSPICFEKHYREYVISTLAKLKILDNLPVKNVEREKAKITIKKYYEYAPYNRPYKENVVSILQKREVGTTYVSQKSSQLKQPYSRESYHAYNRSLSAAKLCSSPRPHLHSVSQFRNSSAKESKTFRPRQFEYHPSNSSLMVFGTLEGQLVVINHESQKVVGYLPSVGALHSILGLCWLKKYPSKLIAGSDNGSLQLYDVRQMLSTVTDRYCSLDASMHTFDEFEQLTSVHINSTDEYFLASGYSKHVALYDIGSGRRLQFLKDLHQEHINVVKFAHHSPTVFATASFDRDVKMWDLRQGTSRPCYTASSSRGNVMVCFSPDDHYLLASAMDNEVNQLLAVDGRLHMQFNIAPVGSAQNYTRSYYMNGRDYVISGSCEENVVRICCAQTGRRLRDISLEGNGSRDSMFVQSLRGDPYRDFHMSILAAYLQPCTKSEIIKVNLLSSGDSISSDSRAQRRRSSSLMGG